MKTEEIQTLFEQFEKAAVTVENVECWSARDLYPILGYTQWRNFMNAVDKAKEACINAEQKLTDKSGCKVVVYAGPVSPHADSPLFIKNPDSKNP